MALSFFAIFVTLMITYSIQGQESHDHDPCGCDQEHMQIRIEQDPSILMRQVAFDQEFRAQHLANMAANEGTIVDIEAPWQGQLEIPINIHIVWWENEPLENLSYEQIISQIIVINEDFNKQNSDWLDVPDEFIDLVADYKISFKLSKIIRVETAKSAFSFAANDIKFTAEGGSDIINGEVVLNFWIGYIASMC